MKKHRFLPLVLLFLFLVGAMNLQGQNRGSKSTKSAQKKTAAAKKPKTKKAAAAAFNPKTDPPFLGANQKWVDSVFKTLTPEERIAQLIMIPVYSNKNQAHIDSISRLVTTYKVGGLIFFQGGPVRQAHMTNRYQRESKVPLMISIDGEWGLAMRLDSTVRFPYQMALGGIEDERLIYDMGAEIARQCRRLGIHVNFAPVIDVNNNANNPVIGFRSFGEDKYNVARKAMAYVKGMQDNKVLANAKHFPGHGDTNVDSHYGLPVIHFSKLRLDSVELYPFRELMANGLGSLMVAHMNIPVLDNTKDLASTLSKPIVTDLLKKEMGYKGLVFTDALNMQGVAKFYAPGVVDVKALLAGNDVLLNTMDVKTTIEEVKKAIANKEITQAEIDTRVRKVLAAKQWMGLDNWKPIETENLIADLNNPTADYINRQLTEASLTLLRNKNQILPIKTLDTLKVAALAIGTNTETDFQRNLAKYTQVDNFFLPPTNSIADLQALKEKLKGYNMILVGVHKLQLKASGTGTFGITAEMNLFLKDLIRTKPTVVSVFGNVYSLTRFEDIEKAHGVLAAYQENELTQDVAAQIIFGGVGAKGKLPVNVSNSFRIGDGLRTEGGLRLAYTQPEAVGLRSEDFAGIDTLVNEAIRAKGTPGAQVLVAKNGKVIYYKSFGYHTYENQTPVQNTDLYDLASVTKITTALAAYMKLNGEGRFDVDKTLGEYLPLMKESNKANLKYRDILTHQARLKSWIPFWREELKKNGELKSSVFSPDSSAKFPIRVAKNLFIHKDHAQEIYKQIKESPLNEKPGYVYSDLSFILAPLVVKNITGEDFESYLKKNIYKPLGATTLTFNPYKSYPLSRIVPTEVDTLFRKQLLHGTVHDEGAAMLGGISGHAGLFGNANDLAKVMQLYLNDGIYAGKRIIADNVVSTFSKCQFCPDNYRALGFDRPSKPGTVNGNAAQSAPAESFGHTGFTGIYSWVDPVNDLVYIFLSNRVHPTRESSVLSKLNTRTKVMQVVYDAMAKAKSAPKAESTLESKR
ncbi:glycoside hydrolase family 3 N-terminal domain-containing protein [Rufibacter psychrotolerans]|uniref:glycoside hydrolase family 3 N-terminal domain-containing protein n=1 Tax=Rufibacter psychrotolerans TaxID=2812556 RepID=UPI00293D2DEA|nr:glycoside hydrolase family 3 N-terminal domain-containing protein [Rufibacter sp. SYSU D00308]